MGVDEQLMREGRFEPDEESSDMAGERSGDGYEETEEAEETGGGDEELLAQAAGLQKQLDAARFKLFIPALLCAGIKDLSDPLSFGIAGTLVNIPISLFLFYIFSVSQRQWKGSLSRAYSQDLTKNFWGKYALRVVIEAIPGANLFPAYTIQVIQIKMLSDKQSSKIRADIMQINSALRNSA